MFGSGLPVCAAYYPAVHELVGHEYNGLLFSSAPELAAHLLRLFQLTPQNPFPFTEESEMAGDDFVHINTSKPTALGIKRISEEKLSAKLEASSKSPKSPNAADIAEPKGTPSSDPTKGNVAQSSVPSTPVSTHKGPLPDIQRLKQGVLAIDTWDENWELSMKPYILEVLEKKSTPLVWSPAFAVTFFFLNFVGAYILSQILKW